MLLIQKYLFFIQVFDIFDELHFEKIMLIHHRSQCGRGRNATCYSGERVGGAWLVG